MAAILINVDNTSNLYTITLDKWEWTGLKVNGEDIPSINMGNVQFRYVQETSGPIHFEATANKNIKLKNPGKPMFLKGRNNEKTYFASINYEERLNPKKIVLNGFLHTFPIMQGAQPSPLLFSQGSMSGVFEVDNH